MELNKDRSGLEAKYFELCQEVVKAEGLSLYDMEYISGSSTLRVFIFNEETGTAILDECARVDRAFTPHAETLEWIPEKLVLEVSSPGVYRNLATLEHFKKALGEKVKLSLKEKLDDKVITNLPKALKGNRKIVAVLKDIRGEELVLGADGFELVVTFDQLKKANLEPDI